MKDEIICDGRIISKEKNPALYNTLNNVLYYYFEHKVDESTFRNPRIRIYYSLDSNLELRCSPTRDKVMEFINKFEDEVIMNISTFNKLIKKLEECE